MKRYQHALWLGLSVLPNAYAAPIAFTDVVDPTDVFLTQGASYGFQHNINDNGFNLTTDTILTASLTVDVYDDGDTDSGYYQSYTYTYDCGFMGWWTCEGTSSYYVYGNPEYVAVSGDGVWLSGSQEVGTTPFTFSINPSYLSDGQLNVTVASTNGDFYFRRSILNVGADRVEPIASPTIDNQVASVPEPNAIVLLGAGLLGVMFARRKIASK